MININSVVLVGRLTKEIELKKTQSNKSVVTFNIAINRRFKQEGQQEADFIQCIAWNQAAEFLSKYASKGSLVSIEGRIQTRNYDDKDGKKVYVTEVIAEQVNLESSKKEDVQPKINSNNDGYDNPTNSPNLEISSDDLPFY